MDVTCLCMTHGRPWLLAEAVESFRRQNLRGLSAELLIVNDCLEQSLHCDVPGVRIVQGMPQFTTVSEKFNYGAAEARGKWLTIWDDDDISLPDRIAWTIGSQDGKPGVVLLRPRWVWHMANGTIRGRGCAQICQATVLRSAWLDVGGANHNEYVDQSLYFKLKKAGHYCEPDQRAEDTHYIYRWAGVGYHDSGEGLADATVRAKRFHEEALKDPRFRYSHVNVVPTWAQDYTAETNRAIISGLFQKHV